VREHHPLPRVAGTQTGGTLPPCFSARTGQTASAEHTAGLDPTYVLAELTGWAIAVLTGVTISLPYLLRRRAASLERLRPHYWIGFTLAGLSLVHAGLAMSSIPTPGGGDWAAGIWIAMGALLLVFGQVTIGAGLRSLRGPERRRRLRLHFLTMTLLVAAGLVHVVLNGPLVRSLLGHGA
jgi:hypothetical protein